MHWRNKLAEREFFDHMRTLRLAALSLGLGSLFLAAVLAIRGPVSSICLVVLGASLLGAAALWGNRFRRQKELFALAWFIYAASLLISATMLQGSGASPIVLALPTGLALAAICGELRAIYLMTEKPRRGIESYYR